MPAVTCLKNPPELALVEVVALAENCHASVGGGGGATGVRHAHEGWRSESEHRRVIKSSDALTATVKKNCAGIEPPT